jgi:hypothetical protein
MANANMLLLAHSRDLWFILQNSQVQIISHPTAHIENDDSFSEAVRINFV